MKKLYFLTLLCCLGFSSFSQVTVTIWATSASGVDDTTGTVTSTTFTPGDMVVTSNTSRGYAVFDLSVIPSGATITSVSAGIDVNAYIIGAPNVDAAWNTYGYNGDLSSFAGAPPVMFGNMVPPATYAGGALYTNAYGPGSGDPVFGSTVNAVGFIQAAVSTPSPGLVSLTYNTVAATTATYYITGEAGTKSTGPGHAPYITVTYCAVPSAVSATAGPNPVCYGTTLNLVGAATNATDYVWTGPNGFTSTLMSPSLTASLTAAGVYTFTATNICGALSNSVTATTAFVSVTPGPITGITNLWAGFTTQLFDPTPGGIWSSGNPTIATVGSSSGTVYGVSAGLFPPGNDIITYTTPGGCTFNTNVLVNQSIFSQIPTITGATALGFPIVSWYPFCSDTTDHSGNGHDLLNYSVPIVPTIITSPAVLTTDRFGIPNNAYAFDGKTTMMQWTTYLPISGPTGDFTYSLWMEADSDQNSVILYNGNLGAYNQITPPYTASDGWGFVMNDGQDWLAPPVGPALPYVTNKGHFVSVLFGGVGQFLGTSVTLNQWHNLMLKKNGGSYNFYVDNVSIGFFIANFNGMSSATNSIFRLGMDSTGTKVFSGKIDDIAVYNRQLNASERDSLYNFNPDARVFSLGNDTVICADSITLFPSPPTIGNDYAWVTSGADTISRDSSVTIDPVAGVSGNTYTLFVGKPFGCHVFDAITVYKDPIPVIVGPPVINLCLGDTVTLTDYFPGASFLWSTGDTAHSIKVFSTGIYSVTLDSGVCTGHDTVNVRVYHIPAIGLPQHISSCQGAPVTLTPIFDTGYVYTWSTVGFPFLSAKDTLTDTSIGTTIFYLTVKDTVVIGGPVGGVDLAPPPGCSVKDTVSVLIVYDTLSFYGRDTAVCKGESWPPPLTTLATNNFIANYQWTPTAGIPVSNVYDPTITPDTSATYILTVTYPGCPDIVDSFHLDVQPPPVISLGNTRDVCQFDTLLFVANMKDSWYTHYSYSWSPGGNLNDSTLHNVVFYADTAIDTVILHVTVSTPLGLVTPADLSCVSSDSVLIYVHPGQFDSSIRDTALCPGDSVQLISLLDTTGYRTGTVVTNYKWTPSMYLSDPSSSMPWVHPITSVDYTLVGTSSYGCRDTTRVSIVVHPAAVIYLGDSVTLYPGESYQISPQTNCVNFLWYPPLGLNLTTVSNPIATPETHTQYIVYASTEDGCKTTDSITIRVDPGTYISVPNAFTPGGSVNSKFFVLKRGIASLNYFRIFNKWGNKVFETTNIDEGWDGMYNGKPQPFGVYVYEVEAVSTGGKVYDRVGNVTLIR